MALCPPTIINVWLGSVSESLVQAGHGRCESFWVQPPRAGKSFVSAGREECGGSCIRAFRRDVGKVRVWALVNLLEVVWTMSLWFRALSLALTTLGWLIAFGTGMRKQARSSSVPFMWAVLRGWTWGRGIALQESARLRQVWRVVAQGSPCQTQVGDPSALLILGYIPSAFSFIQSVSAPIILGNGLMIVLGSIFYYRYKNIGYVFVDLIIFTDNSMVLYRGDETLGKEMMLYVFFFLVFFLNFTSWEARNAQKLWANKNICCIYSRIQISAGMKFNVKKFVLQYEVKWSLWCLVRERWNTAQSVASFQSVLHMLKVLQTRPWGWWKILSDIMLNHPPCSSFLMWPVFFLPFFSCCLPPLLCPLFVTFHTFKNLVTHSKPWEKKKPNTGWKASEG